MLSPGPPRFRLAAAAFGLGDSPRLPSISSPSDSSSSKMTFARSITFFGSPASRATCMPYDLSAAPFSIVRVKIISSFHSLTLTRRLTSLGRVCSSFVISW